jgi:hypothetical protein
VESLVPYTVDHLQVDLLLGKGRKGQEKNCNHKNTLGSVEHRDLLQVVVETDDKMGEFTTSLG